jgi:hypothetical protein
MGGHRTPGGKGGCIKEIGKERKKNKSLKEELKIKGAHNLN